MSTAKAAERRGCAASPWEEILLNSSADGVCLHTEPILVVCRILNIGLGLDMERGTMRRVLNEHKQGLRGGGVVGRNAKRVRRGDRLAFPDPDITPREGEKLLERQAADEFGEKLDPRMKSGDAILGFRPERNLSQTGPDVYADKLEVRRKKPLSSHFSSTERTIKTNRAGPPDMKVTPSRTKTDMQKEPGARPGPTSYWSVTEQEDFTRYIARFGKDWETIAFHMGNKTQTMVRNQYLRLIEGGNKDLQRVAEEADKRRRGSRLTPLRISALPKTTFEFNKSDSIAKIILGDRKSEEVGISSASPHLLSMSDKRFPNADDLKGAATNSESPPPTPSQSNKPLRRGSPGLELPPLIRGFNRDTAFTKIGLIRRGSTRAQNSTSQHPPRSGKRKQAKGEERFAVAVDLACERAIEINLRLDWLIKSSLETFDLGALAASTKRNSGKSTTLSSNFKDSGLYMRYTISQDASMKTSSRFQGTLNSVLDRKRKFRLE